MKKLRTTELGRKSAEEFRAAEKFPITVVLDNVRSMHNVGSVFRTCDAFNIEKLWLCGITGKPPHREITKTAIGAERTVEWEYSASARECVIELKKRGYTIIGVEQVEGAMQLGAHTFADRQALVFGNEIDGVSEEVLALCDHALEIPQWGSKHSLNISVAVGVVLFEIVKELRQ